jgi:hypothetical protein
MENEINSIIQQLQVCKSTQASLAKQKAELLADKDYGTGTANIKSGVHRIKVVISKKVSYDQEGLKQVYDLLASRGEDPNEYMKVKLDVAEGAYKNWPSTLQALFEPYRTVETGKPTITIEE